MDIYSTADLLDSVARSESLEEYKQILTRVDEQKKSWMWIIDKIIKENNYSVSKFAQLCGVSRQSVQKWVNGTLPKSRNTFIRIGFAAKYNLEQMNHFLQRYGCCNGLYSKNLEDSVCIFVLSSEKIEHTYSTFEKILGIIQEEIITDYSKMLFETSDTMLFETSTLDLELIRIQTIPQFVDFVKQKTLIYKNAYYKLYAYIEEFIRKNLLMDGEDSVYLLANSQGWSSSLRQCVSEISQKKWYPQRNKIIFLGIHLNMKLSQINEMLGLAKMENLCAKIPFENAIIYALENAELENRIQCDGTNELGIYVKNVLKKLNINDFEIYMDELPDDDEADM